ncbi:Putative antirepressor [Flavobacterium indicum GPTSA100-9 = DSM 17447]|uniref:Putative antirepressor n=1 Tax=Flavobacterium indicum (strain DSM 17447 / CIP 109464 / GPTSA100-9) TaxID=1094466 RepID=H8XTW2_FLAIG|nr:M56 family metallopeptidase [Flavobacterium indicum]CCG53692.1 Putative antirepressor [Flavobacterium indicum GPTSA100-9 = DSM 17447]
MHPLFEYLLKANGLLICFYLLYKFLLAKDTFFQFSRYYLLGGIVVSVVLPFITFTKIQYIEVKEVLMPKSASTETVNFVPVTSVEPVHSINWETIMLFAYGVIASILILKLLIGLGKLFSVINQSERIEKQRKTYLQSHLVQSPFSFFNYIVYNPELINQDELEAILLHEEAHSNQNHSVDTLLVQFITIFFWFNPVVWLYQKSVVQNLEFLADEAAIAQVKDRIVYQKAMLKFNTKTASFVASNSFNQSLIKKRIVMLNKKQTSKKNVWKYGLILPVLVGFMLLFQVKTVAQEVKSKGKSKKTITKEAQHEKEIETKIIINEEGNTEMDSVKKTKTVIYKTNSDEKLLIEGKTPVIIVDGKEIQESELKKVSPEKIVTVDVIKGNQAVNRFGEKGKDGIVVIETVKNIQGNEVKVRSENKVIQLDNGDGVVIYDKNKLKLPGQPTIVVDVSNVELFVNDVKKEASEISKITPESIKNINVYKNTDSKSKIFITTK